jgi:hypothetical protein
MTGEEEKLVCKYVDTSSKTFSIIPLRSPYVVPPSPFYVKQLRAGIGENEALARSAKQKENP